MTPKHLSLILITSLTGLPALPACSLGPSDAGTGPSQTESLTSGGLRRSVIVYQPSLPAPAAGWPVLLAFHGAGGTSADMRAVMQVEALADRNGVLVVYPDAAPGSQGTWALGCFQCTWADVAGVDDYGFVRDLVDTLVARYGVDRRRVFATGLSLGGSFANDIACRPGDLIAGVAVVASLPSADELVACAPSRAHSIALMIGDQDPNIPWGGGGAYQYLGAEADAGLWGGWNECSSPPTTARLPDRDGNRRAVAVTIYGTCRDGTSVRLYRIEGGGHAWPRGDLDASGEIMALFFSSN